VCVVQAAAERVRQQRWFWVSAETSMTFTSERSHQYGADKHEGDQYGQDIQLQGDIHVVPLVADTVRRLT
jgi:hypothetical protein